MLPVSFASLLDDHDAANAAITREFNTAYDAGMGRGTHAFGGRCENLYMDTVHVPALLPVLERACELAAGQLGCAFQELSVGFWFNRMEPGQSTTLHSHDDDDELLSGVYYVSVPPRSGDLILHPDTGPVRLRPRAGQLVLFPPALPHEVGKNRSRQTRLSIGMNFGIPSR